MFLFSRPQIEQLIGNGQPNERHKDHMPVVKLFRRGTGHMWLLTYINPDNLIQAYGLYDLDSGAPEIGIINLDHILYSTKAGELEVERDTYFVARYPISVYETAAKHLGYITEVDSVLKSLHSKKSPGYFPQ